MEDIQDTIDNYLLGRLSGVEAKEFEQEMVSDGDVRERFLFTQMVKHELSDRNEKLRNMQQWRKQTDRNRHPNPIRRVLWYSIGGFSAAAMVVLGVFLFRPEPFSTTVAPASVPYAQATPQIDMSLKINPNEMSNDAHRNVMAYNANISAKRTQPTFVEYSAKKVSSSHEVAVSMSAPDSYSQSQYERYMREVEYYQKQAENYRREAEYYKKQAENYEREQEYHLKQAEKYQREAANYSKRGDTDHAKTQTRYAQNEIDKAKMQASYARNAWDKYKTQMSYAKNADEKAATNLQYAREALK